MMVKYWEPLARHARELGGHGAGDSRFNPEEVGDLEEET